MLELLTDPFSQSVGLRALAELTILGAVCGSFGVWILLYRQSYAAESISHAMLPGLAAASLVGLPVGLGAAAGLGVAAVVIAACSRQRAVDSDVAVAVAVTTLFGAGTLLALSADVPLRLGDILFGDPLGVSDGDLLAAGVLAALLVGAMLAGHRSLSVVGFDPQVAANLGTSPTRVAGSVLVLLAATTLIAVAALGNLLVLAIVIGPAAAALRLCSRLRPALLVAGAIGVAAGVAGLYLSFYANLAAGASVALCAIGAFALTMPFGGQHRGSRLIPS